MKKLFILTVISILFASCTELDSLLYGNSNYNSNTQTMPNINYQPVKKTKKSTKSTNKNTTKQVRKDTTQTEKTVKEETKSETRRVKQTRN